MREVRRRWIGLLLALAVLLPRRAGADEALARKLYAEGEVAFAGGRYVDAARAFEAAFAEARDPSLLWNVAQSYRKQYEIDADVVSLKRAAAVYKNYLEILPSGVDHNEANAALAAVAIQIDAAEKAPAVERSPMKKSPPPPEKLPVVSKLPAALLPAPVPETQPTRRRNGLWIGIGVAGGALLIGGVTVALGVSLGHKTVEDGLTSGNIDPGFQRIMP